MSQTFTMRIDSVAAGGDGIGRHEGMAVFVPRTAPGDLARVEGTVQGRLMRGRLLEIMEPSANRVQPLCHHYVQDRCGGCQLQHLAYDGQLAAKAGIIRDSLQRIGRVQLDAPAVQPSPSAWRYRRKLTLAMRRAGNRWYAGLRRFDDPADVFELRDCPITAESVVGHWRAVMQHQHLLPQDAPSLRGAVREMSQGFAFTIEGGTQWDGAHLFAEIPAMAELWWRPRDGALRLLHSRVAEGAGAGASFVQVNAALAMRLHDFVAASAALERSESAIDAYAGTGEIAMRLAQSGARVTAIEVDRTASRESASRLPMGSSAVAARVEDVLPRALPADVVVVNPPRAGLDARVPRALNAAERRPRALIYVSCDPGTLARDVRRLDRYVLRAVRGFDMFPQTAHVETVCELVPAA